MLIPGSVYNTVESAVTQHNTNNLKLSFPREIGRGARLYGNIKEDINTI